MNPQQLASAQSVNSGPSLPGVGASSNPNLLERLLPTAGAIGGGLLGTLTDPLTLGAGSIAGAAGGSALGQQLENSLTGGSNSTFGAAAQGAFGGGIGKGLEALGGLGAGALASKAASDAETSAGADLRAQWNILPTDVKRANHFQSTMSALKNYGITDLSPENLENISSQVTGPQGSVVSDLVRSAMEGNDSNVDLTGTRALAGNIAGSPELATAGPTVGMSFASTINNVLGLSKPGEINNIPASDVYEARQALKNLAYVKGTHPALSGAYKSVVNSLDDALSLSGVDQTASLQGLSKEQLATLKNISPQLAFDVQAAANTSVGALRGVQKPFVNASDLAKAYKSYAEGVDQTPAPTSGGSGLLNGLLGGGNKVGTLGELGGGAETFMGHPAVGLPMMALSAAMKNPGATGDILSKVSGSALPDVVGQTAAHLPTSGAPAGGNVNSFQTSPTNVGPSQAWAALFDPQALPQLQKAAAAQSALQALEQQYGNSSGGGILSALAALIPGTAANQYGKSKQAASAALSQATGSPIQAILSSLPSLMASPQSASTNFGGLQGQVSNLANINPGPGSLLAGVQ